jgi:hypothetical protein
MQEHYDKQRLKNVTKKELIDKIIADELAIGSAESKL